MNTIFPPHQIDGRSAEWMIELGKTSRTAQRVVVSHFISTWSNIAFAKCIALECGYSIVSWDPELIFEKPVLHPAGLPPSACPIGRWA